MSKTNINIKIVIILLILSTSLNLLQWHRGTAKDEVIQKIYEWPFYNYVYRHDMHLLTSLKQLKSGIEEEKERMNVASQILRLSYEAEGFYGNVPVVGYPVFRVTGNIPDLGNSPYYTLQQEVLRFIKNGEQINIDYYIKFMDKKIEYNHYLFHILGMEKLIYDEYELETDMKAGKYVDRIVQKGVGNSLEYPFTKEEMDILSAKIKELGLDEFFDSKR